MGKPVWIEKLEQVICWLPRWLCPVKALAPGADPQVLIVLSRLQKALALVSL